VKDPDDGNLDRIQIIKGWTQSGQNFEKVYDVAWSGQRKPDPPPAKCPRSAAQWTLRKLLTQTPSALRN
jgi:Protein of unknown function (DUF3604).